MTQRHAHKYVIVYRTECVRNGSQMVRDVTFKCFADTGLGAMKHLRHERGILKSEIKAIYRMDNGERVKVL